MTDYNHLIPAVEDTLLAQNIPFPSWKAGESERKQFRYAVLRAMIDAHLSVPELELHRAAEDLAGRLMGLGVLEPFLREERVEEVIVRAGCVQVERGGRIETVGALASDEYFRALALRVAELGGKVLSAANPFVLVDLPGGHRFTAVIPPLSPNGTHINIRVFARTVWSLEDLVARALLARAQADLLAAVMAERRTSVLISGKPGAGKTTLLNALLAALPPATQLAIAETFEELKVERQPPPARAVTREDVAVGQVTLRETVNRLYTRMRPDVLVVGEIVGDEAPEFLRAVNLGVMALSTIHGNSALDALLRLENLALQENVPELSVRERVARGIGLVVHVDKELASGRRRVAEIARVEGVRAGQYTLVNVASDG